LPPLKSWMSPEGIGLQSDEDNSTSQCILVIDIFAGNARKSCSLMGCK